MLISFDWRKFCSAEALASGTRWLERYQLTQLRFSTTATHCTSITGKAVNSFNYVNHVELTLDAEETALQSFSCDCVDGRTHRFCRHCVALALACSSEFVDDRGFTPSKPTATPTDDIPLQEDEPLKDLDLDIEIKVADTPAQDDEHFVLPLPAHITNNTTVQAEAKGTDENVVFCPRSMSILFGNELGTGEPINWHPNNTEEVLHTNTGIIGTMGTGKTQFTKSLTTQLYLEQHNNFDGYPLGILIFDYKGDYNETKRSFVDAVSARVLKPYKLPFNPFSLNRTKNSPPLLPVHTANSFTDTIAKIYTLGVKQQQILLSCILKAYVNKGIRPEEPATWSRPAPTFEQVYRVYESQYLSNKPDSLTAAINKLQQFCIFESDPKKACSLATMLRGVVVLDLSGYDEDIQSLIVAITLDQFYAQMQVSGSSQADGTYRQLRNLILVDEADNFMRRDFPALRKIMKEGREFGVGIILSSQSLSHFVGGDDDYSRYVSTWVVHGLHDLRPSDVEYVFKLQPKCPETTTLYAAIKGLRKHESVVKVSNDKPRVIMDKAFWQLLNELESSDKNKGVQV